MPTRIKWTVLNYNLPPEPSKNRVYTWRKLRELGALAINHGVAVLPKDSKKVPELVLLCERVKTLGGEAAILEMTYASVKDEQRLVHKFEQLSEQECTALLSSCENLLSMIQTQPVRSDDETGEEIRRMVRQYGRVRGRNHFGIALQVELEHDIDRIFDRCVSDAADFAVQIQKMLDKARF